MESHIQLGSGISAEGRILAKTAAVALAAIGSILLLGYEHGADHGLYAVVGERILEGGIPYRDAWDFKPPGIYMLFATAQWLFGPVPVGIRLLEVLALLVQAVLFGRLATVAGSSREIGWLAGAASLFVQGSLGFWHTAQPEVFGGVFVAAGILQAATCRSALSAFWCGFWFCCAALLKPPLGGGILFAAIVVWRLGATGRERWTRLGMLAAGGLTPVSMVLAWLTLKGGWHDLLQIFFLFVPRYTALGYSEAGLLVHGGEASYRSLVCFTPWILAGVVLGGCAAPGRLKDDVPIQILGAVLTGIVGVLLQAKHFDYHYTGHLSLLLLLGGLGAAAAAIRWPRLVRVETALLAMSVLYFSPGPWQEQRWRVMSDVQRWLEADDPVALQDWRDRRASGGHVSAESQRLAAARIRQLVPEGRSIFVWGFSPSLYWMSRRPPASRWIYNIAQRVEWVSQEARACLVRDLLRHPPALIVVEEGDVVPKVVGHGRDSSAELTLFPELTAVLEQYELKERIGDLSLWLARGADREALGPRNR